jgi:hypothetical protein
VREKTKLAKKARNERRNFYFISSFKEVKGRLKKLHFSNVTCTAMTRGQADYARAFFREPPIARRGLPSKPRVVGLFTS